MAAHLGRVGSVVGVPQIGLPPAVSPQGQGVGSTAASRICSDGPASLPFFFPVCPHGPARAEVPAVAQQ